VGICLCNAGHWLRSASYCRFRFRPVDLCHHRRVLMGRHASANIFTNGRRLWDQGPGYHLWDNFHVPPVRRVRQRTAGGPALRHHRQLYLALCSGRCPFATGSDLSIQHQRTKVLVSVSDADPNARGRRL
ncbi:uncharacterized protein METZ01_LOCUS289303, partial [marine metagenome]